MPGLHAVITEIATGLGTLAPDLTTATASRPAQLRNVTDDVWHQLVDAHSSGHYARLFTTAFANGAAFLTADDGLRRRPPRLVEWKGPHRPPGDDVIPADLRIDHVYQVSCKYLSRILQNSGPARLFDRLLIGEERSSSDWFAVVAPTEYQAFYTVVRSHVGGGLPVDVAELTAEHRPRLKEALRPRALPVEAQPSWAAVCETVASTSAARWSGNLDNPRRRLRMLWRLLRIGDAPYFTLGADTRHLPSRFRIASAWDWIEAYQLRTFDVAPRRAGQPEVTWRVAIRHRLNGQETEVRGHVEIRWSHGRFHGAPEAKVYLDSPLGEVPGYYPLT